MLFRSSEISYCKNVILKCLFEFRRRRDIHLHRCVRICKQQQQTNKQKKNKKKTKNKKNERAARINCVAHI